MKPIKPNRPSDLLEFDPYAPRLALALECTPARQDRLLNSFLLFGAHGLPQLSQDAEKVAHNEYLVGHA
jgi:hypothetical protein